MSHWVKEADRCAGLGPHPWPLCVRHSIFLFPILVLALLPEDFQGDISQTKSSTCLPLHLPQAVILPLIGSPASHKK